MTTKSFIKTIGSKGLLADYNTEGKKLQTEDSIDQTYSSTSTKAQSGVAVNEAFKTRETSSSDDSYTYIGMKKTYGSPDALYWKLVSFNALNNYWTLQFEVDVSNGRKGNSSYDTEIYETKRLTICGDKPGFVKYASELRHVAQGIDSSRGYDNNIYYEISGSNLVTVYIKAINRPNKTQICRLTTVRNVQGISNITWHEATDDAGTQPTNPVKFKEFFPAIASTSSNIGSDSVPVYVNNGIPRSCNTSNLKAGKDDDGNVIKNTYQKKLTFDTTPTAGSTNPVTSDGILNMKPLLTRFDNETNSRLIVFCKFDTNGECNDIVRKFGLQYGKNSELLFQGSVKKDNTTDVVIKILNDSIVNVNATKRLKASIFNDSSNNSYFSIWLDGSISQPGWAYYSDYYTDTAEREGAVRHFTEFDPSTYTLVRDLTIKYEPLTLPYNPSTTGTQVLKCINGVIQWVNE